MGKATLGGQHGAGAPAELPGAFGQISVRNYTSCERQFIIQASTLESDTTLQIKNHKNGQAPGFAHSTPVNPH